MPPSPQYSPPPNGYRSVKSSLSITHRGNPSAARPTIATSSKPPTFPEDLWQKGTLIYSLYDPSQCLPPPTSQSDRMLRFNSRFESGNLLYAYQLTTFSYHLILEYDVNRSHSSQWFYFQISNTRSDFKYRFYISGFHKNNGVFNTGAKVFWYSTTRSQRSNIGWCRGGSDYGYTTTFHDGTERRCTLQFQLCFPYDNDIIYLSYSIPYTYSQLMSNIMHWGRNSLVAVENLCLSREGKNCPLMTITNKRSNIPIAQKHSIIFTARVHPGETNSSIVMHGMIEFLLSGSPMAKYLVDHFVIKIVPMIAVDGVVEGTYRTGSDGFDLNRMWENPNEQLHPTVYYTKQMIADTVAERPLDVFIDFHGHSRQHGAFAYGCPSSADLGPPGMEKTLPKLLGMLSDAFSWNRCIFSFPRERGGAARIVVRRQFNVMQSYCIESSFGGFAAGSRTGLLFDETVWKEIGIKCGEALYHMTAGTRFSQIGMKVSIPSTPKKKQREPLTANRIPPPTINLMKMPLPALEQGSAIVLPKLHNIQFV